MLATGVVLLQQRRGIHGLVPASLLGGLASLHSASIPRCESVPWSRTWGVKEEAMLRFRSFEETSWSRKYLSRLLEGQSWLQMEGKVAVSSTLLQDWPAAEQGVLFLTLLVSTLLGSSQASQTSTLSVCAALGCFGSACLPAHSPFSLLSPAFSLLLIPCGFAAH